MIKKNRKRESRSVLVYPRATMLVLAALIILVVLLYGPYIILPVARDLGPILIVVWIVYRIGKSRARQSGIKTEKVEQASQKVPTTFSAGVHGDIISMPSKIDAIKVGYKAVHQHNISVADMQKLSDKELKHYYNKGLKSTINHPRANQGSLKKDTNGLVYNIKMNWHIILLVLTLISLTYWLLIRPASVKKGCDSLARKQASEVTRNVKESYELYYAACLHKNGI